MFFKQLATKDASPYCFFGCGCGCACCANIAASLAA